MRREAQVTVAFVLLFLVVKIVVAQPPDGIGPGDDFAKGNYQAVVDRLRNASTVEELNYLGLAYERLGRTDSARKAYEKAFLTSYENFRLSALDFLKPGGPDFLQFLVEQRKNNQLGVHSGQRLRALKSDIFDFNAAIIRVNALHAAVKQSDSKGEIVGSSSGGFKIIERSRASSPQANGNGEISNKRRPSGDVTVLILIIYGANGTIDMILPLDEIFDAYTTAAVVASAKIKFIPAMSNGKPVSSYSRFSYRFSIR